MCRQLDCCRPQNTTAINFTNNRKTIEKKALWKESILIDAHNVHTDSSQRFSAYNYLVIYFLKNSYAFYSG